ncbi:unnamed protein product [Allacma fusca]|uniref:Uncharacterized protein n=1 Tax=Allacma fusca TaxID=39272 RepID=A0A8J2K6R2_9HEXA|nr:unnamed protein product [Allacma fusca]
MTRSKAEKKRQQEMALEFMWVKMSQCTTEARQKDRSIPLNPEERELYTSRFEKLDGEKKGYMSINALRRGLQVQFHDFKMVSINNPGTLFDTRKTKESTKLMIGLPSKET